MSDNLTSIPEEDLDFLGEQSADLLRAARTNDSNGIYNAMVATGRRLGDAGVFALCCTLSAALQQHAMPGTKIGDAVPEGKALLFEQATDASLDDSDMWAIQFVAAFISGDKVRAHRLFKESTKSDETLVNNFIALVCLAGDELRRAQQRAEEPS